MDSWSLSAATSAGMSFGPLARVAGVAITLAFLISLLGGFLPDGPPIKKPRLVEPSAVDQLPCQDVLAEKPLVILVLGQSNAANHGALEHDPSRHKVSLVHGNQCFMSGAPLPGATGRGGSIWPGLGQLLAPQKTLFSVLAVESMAIREWVGPGILNWELRHQLRSLQQLGVKIDLVIWQQGEADARLGTSADSYQSDFLRLVAFFRNMGVTSPIMVALSSHCRGFDGVEIRSALTKIAMQRNDVWLGPDTDQLGGASRRDGCHFSSEGLDEAAHMWAAAIKPRLPELFAERLRGDRT